MRLAKFGLEEPGPSGGDTRAAEVDRIRELIDRMRADGRTEDVPDMEKLKQKKHLPGQKSALGMTVSPSAAAAAPPPPANGGGDVPPGWKAETDPNSGQKYYVNSATGATQWTVPTV